MTTPEPTAQEPTSEEPLSQHRSTRLGTSAPVEPLHIPTRRIVLVGTGCWALALVVTLAVPALHTGERSWWPWTCVSAVLLGAFAWWFVGRGKGSAVGA